jgi:tape measure domain-containing protein
MNDEIAKLGFEIDTAALVQASAAARQTAAALNQVADAADKQAASTRGATNEARQNTTATQQQGAAAGAAAQNNNAAATAAVTHATAQRTLGAALNTAAQQAQATATNLQGLGANLSMIGASMTSGPSGIINAVGAASRGLSAFSGMMGPIGAGAALLGTSILGLGVAYVGVAAATVRAQEQFLLIEARLKNVYGSGQAAAMMFREVGKLADEAGVSIAAASDAFLRLARNNEAIGLTRQQMLELTESVQKLGRISGASTGELASGMLQFSQALAAGRLNGDELRSIMENMPALAKAIAEGLGVSIGALRAMGAAGELTGDKITGALLGQLPKIRAEFATLPQTSDQAFTRVGNSVDRLLASIGERIKSSQFISGLANSLASAVDAATSLVQSRTNQQRAAALVRNAGDTANIPDGPFSGSRLAQRRRRMADAQMEEANRLDPDARESVRNANILARMEEERVSYRSTFVRSQSVLKELDDVGNKQKQLREQIKTLEDAYASFQSKSFLFDAKEAEQLERYPGFIAALKRELEGALLPLQAFERETSRLIADLERFGAGGAASLGAEARGLVSKDATGQTTLDQAISAVTSRRVNVDMAQRNEELQTQITQQRELASVIGRGVAAEQALEAQQKALNLQLQLFGRDLTPEAANAMSRYRDSMLELLRAQKALTDQQKLYNAEQEIAILRTVNAAAATGRFTQGQLRELEARARFEQRLRNEQGGANDNRPAAGPSVPTTGVQQAIQSIANEIVGRFEGARVTSAFRPNDTGSQHSHGNAVDISLRALSPEQRRALIEEIARDIQSGTGAFANVRGVGTYDATGSLLHLDTRPRTQSGGLIDAWGPNRSASSLDQTPSWFQELLAPLRAMAPRAPGNTGVAVAQAEEEQRQLGTQRQSVDAINQANRAAREAQERARARSTEELKAIEMAQRARQAAADQQQNASEVERAELARLSAEQREQLEAKFRGEREATAAINEQAKAERQTGVERRVAIEQQRLANELRQMGIVNEGEITKEIERQARARVAANDNLDTARRQAQAYEDIWTRGAQSIGGALEGAFRDAVMQADIDAKKVIRGIIADVGQAIIRASVTVPLTEAMKGFNPLSLFGFAYGGAFDGPTRYFSAGGILSGPKAFGMAGGMGVAGEAGPEAVLPLKRGNDGRLGVAADGGGGMTVQVFDMRSTSNAEPVETQETTGPDGQRMMQIYIRDEVRRVIGDGDADKQMRGAYGLNRVVMRR